MRRGTYLCMVLVAMVTIMICLNEIILSSVTHGVMSVAGTSFSFRLHTNNVSTIYWYFIYYNILYDVIILY